MTHAFLAGSTLLSAFLPVPGARDPCSLTHTLWVWVSYFYYTSPVKSEPPQKPHHTLAMPEAEEKKGHSMERCFCNLTVTSSYPL